MEVTAAGIAMGEAGRSLENLSTMSMILTIVAENPASLQHPRWEPVLRVLRFHRSRVVISGCALFVDVLESNCVFLFS